MGPDATSCTVPKEAVDAAPQAFLQMVAYGQEATSSIPNGRRIRRSPGTGSGRSRSATAPPPAGSWAWPCPSMGGGRAAAGRGGYPGQAPPGATSDGTRPRANAAGRRRGPPQGDTAGYRQPDPPLAARRFAGGWRRLERFSATPGLRFARSATRFRALAVRRCAPVAQLDRASDYEFEGRTFESFRARQFPMEKSYFSTSCVGCEWGCPISRPNSRNRWVMRSSASDSMATFPRSAIRPLPSR